MPGRGCQPLHHLSSRCEEIHHITKTIKETPEQSHEFREKTKTLFSLSISLFRGLAIPFDSFRMVLGNPHTFFIAQPEFILRLGIPLFRSLAIPFDCLP